MGIVSEPTKFERIHQLPRYTLSSSSVAMWVWSSFASLSISRITSSVRSNSSMVFSEPCITNKSIVNVRVSSFSALLLELICSMVFSSTFFLPVACALRAPPGSHRPVLRRTRGEHLSIRVRSYRDQLHGPIRCPQHLFNVHDHGRQRSGGATAHFPPLRWPDCTLSRLRAEEYDRPVTQSIATPEPSSRTIPTPDRTLVAC